MGPLLKRQANVHKLNAHMYVYMNIMYLMENNVEAIVHPNGILCTFGVRLEMFHFPRKAH